MTQHILLTCILVCLPMCLSAPAPVQAQPASAADTLNQYVADLQKNPKDGALRTKIIELALKMDPAPAIPADAKKFAARGAAAAEGAKNETDFAEAAAEFEKVVNLAPWVGNGYRNLAIVQDKAGQYDAALNSLAWYRLTKPAAEGVEFADDLKAKIEFRKEKAAKQAQATEESRRKEAQATAEDAKAKEAEKNRPKEAGRDGPFIAYDNGTVLDTRTKLMWAASGKQLPWGDAKSYCEKYAGGGYKDWRMPTQEELGQGPVGYPQNSLTLNLPTHNASAALYDQAKTSKADNGEDVHITKLIHLAGPFIWADGEFTIKGQYHWAPYCNFLPPGERNVFPPTAEYEALPVRSAK